MNMVNINKIVNKFCLLTVMVLMLSMITQTVVAENEGYWTLIEVEKWDNFDQQDPAYPAHYSGDEGSITATMEAVDEWGKGNNGIRTITSLWTPPPKSLTPGDTIKMTLTATVDKHNTDRFMGGGIWANLDVFGLGCLTATGGKIDIGSATPGTFDPAGTTKTMDGEVKIPSFGYGNSRDTNKMQIRVGAGVGGLVCYTYIYEWVPSKYIDLFSDREYTPADPTSTFKLKVLIHGGSPDGTVVKFSLEDRLGYLAGAKVDPPVATTKNSWAIVDFIPPDSSYFDHHDPSISSPNRIKVTAESMGKQASYLIYIVKEGDNTSANTVSQPPKKGPNITEKVTDVIVSTTHTPTTTSIGIPCTGYWGPIEPLHIAGAGPLQPPGKYSLFYAEIPRSSGDPRNWAWRQYGNVELKGGNRYFILFGSSDIPQFFEETNLPSEEMLVTATRDSAIIWDENDNTKDMRYAYCLRRIGASPNVGIIVMMSIIIIVYMIRKKK